MMADLKIRSMEPELMDDPSCDKAHLFATFKQFRLINLLFTRSRYLAKSRFFNHIRRRNEPSFTLFDLGAGGGDFALWFSAYLSVRGVSAKIVCIDNDPRAVEFASTACRGRGNIVIVNESAMRLETLDIRPEYIYSCHLLHHLTDEDVVALLRAVNGKARLGYVLCDLERSRLWGFLFGLFSAIFLRNSFARPDGLLSIRKSFTKAELEALVLRSGITPRPHVRRLFPGRLVVEYFADGNSL
jgi:2-polyprenyl-3-methyl-5-hydroxy-6-metoxy-1,4-benzoquinol methylase